MAVCAPTGKAAVRVTESLADQGITHQARTIHSLLRPITSEGGWVFDHDESNPLPYDYIIVDEASMVDVPLMSALLRARGNAHILFLGDPDQLSPVGPGAPLRDMIAAGVPCGHLTEIQRNAGDIVKTCAAIRDKKPFDILPAIDLYGKHNLAGWEARSPEMLVSELKKAIRDAETEGHDPIRDVQIVVPVNDKSPVGRKPLNRILQSHLNPTGATVHGSPFRVGDKIICLSNGMVPAIQAESRDEQGRVRVANGEQAIVMEVAVNYTVARMEAPERIVRIPRGQKQEGESGCDWDLAYAISVHKSQGSEFPVVLVVIDSYPGAVRLCDRHWIYTAISRAKTYCVLIGNIAVAKGMPQKSWMWRRKTFLVEDLRESRLGDFLHEWDQCCNEIGV